MKARLLRLCAAAVAALTFLAAAPRASADTITLQLSPSLPANGNGVNGGGAFHWTQSTPINTQYGTAITTYCADVNDGIRSGSFNISTSLTAIPNISTTDETSIKTLYDHFYNSSFTYNGVVSQAAFQYALWKLIYGSTYTIPAGSTADQIEAAKEANYLLAGKFYNGTTYANTEHDLANAYLLALVPNDTSTNPNDPNGLKRNQDQIMLVKNVPAPPGLMLAGVGVLALVGRARLSRRTPTPA
jgi:hypothetical protein